MVRETQYEVAKRLIGLLAIVTTNVDTHELFVAQLVRFGLLASTVAMVVGGVVGNYPLTLDFSAPYAGASMLGMLVLLAYAVYGLRVSLAGRPVFADRLLQERSA